VTELIEGGVAQRGPSLADRKIRVLTRRDPLAVQPGTSLAECLRAIQRIGVGDSVLVVDEDRHLIGVLTERDIFGRLIETGEDLSQPVETMMNAQPRRLSLDSTVRDAIALMELAGTERPSSTTMESWPGSSITGHPVTCRGVPGSCSTCRLDRINA
jgi:signal-transduction protein with cAMP-binding, CBS, and nucleotidyltransferase domain